MKCFFASQCREYKGSQKCFKSAFQKIQECQIYRDSVPMSVVDIFEKAETKGIKLPKWLIHREIQRF